MRLRDLLELCRVSNLPTVWSNAVLGFYAGVATDSAVHLNDHPELQPATGSDLIQMFSDRPMQIALMLLALVLPYSLLYSGGMVLNDYMDRTLDARERPGRPIPSGRVRPNTALCLSVGFLCLGLGGIYAFGNYFGWQADSVWITTLFGLGLAVMIVLYNCMHQRSAKSVLLMGSCRAMVVLTAAGAVISPEMHWAWWLYIAAPAFTLLAYTVLISIVARREVESGGPKKFGGPKTIMNMIAAMPLLDAVWLVVMGLWPVSVFCVGCAVLTKLGHRKVAGS